MCLRVLLLDSLPPYIIYHVIIRHTMYLICYCTYATDYNFFIFNKIKKMKKGLGATPPPLHKLISGYGLTR